MNNEIQSTWPGDGPRGTPAQPEPPATGQGARTIWGTWARAVGAALSRAERHIVDTFKVPPGAG